MKILFINDHFERGGAGRVAAIQCNGLFRRGYEIKLVTDTKFWERNYPIEPKIPELHITTKSQKPGGFAKLMKWLKCARDIRKYINLEQPDIIIAIQSMPYLCTYLANIGLHYPVIVADHTSFNRHQGLLIDFIRYRLYGKADGISILTQRDERILGDKYPQKQVIYNPLSFPVLEETTVRRKNILCVGRLEVWEIKGLDIIIDIWSHIQAKYSDWTLEIAGDGKPESQQKVNNMIAEHGLEGRVALLGHVSDMKACYSESSIFALPSRMEGFPMALLEAMSQGCACVAFHIEGASSEMVEEGAGLVVQDGDVDAFERSLDELLQDEEKRHSYSVKAIKSASRFTEESFINRWEELIRTTMRKRKK